MPIGLILTCAGSAQRLQTDGKALVQIDGIELIIRSCLPFLPHVDAIVVLTLAHQQSAIQTLFAQHGIHATCLAGGPTRYASVKIGFDWISPIVDSVLIHDGARGFIDTSLIERILMAGQDHKAVIPVLPISDTIKEIHQNHVIKTLNRDKLARVQTPQFFDCNLLKKAYKNPHSTLVTDESSLIEQLGEMVRTVPGDPHNIKITYPEDLQMHPFAL